MFISPAFAQAGGGGDLISAFLPFILIIGVFYFLMIRPQQKKQKEHKAKLEAIRRGDKVIMGGGIYGHVRQVEDQILTVEIAPSVSVEVLRTTVLDVVAKTEPSRTAAAAAKPAAKKAASKKAVGAKSAKKPAAKKASKKPTAKENKVGE